MKKSKPEKITMNKLALMIGNGFNDMDEKFKKVDERFTDLEKKLKKEILDTKNELKAELNKKVDRFEHKSLEIQVEKIEEKIETINRK